MLNSVEECLLPLVVVQLSGLNWLKGRELEAAESWVWDLREVVVALSDLVCTMPLEMASASQDAPWLP